MFLFDCECKNEAGLVGLARLVLEADLCLLSRDIACV